MVHSPNLIKHCLATEAIMRRLAKQLGEDEELWGLTGLLHDIDLEHTRDDPNQHAKLGAQILEEKGFPQAGVKAVLAHNGEVLGIEREGMLEHGLTSAETVTGMIVATALIYPDKKLDQVKIKSITKRMKEKRFAENVDRDKIRECEHLGLELPDFIQLSLEAMQQISLQLGL